MNVSTAAQKTKDLITNHEHGWGALDDHSTPEHCVWMCDEMISEKVKDDKAHRWLGWVQACICIFTNHSLEEMKTINKES